MNFELRKCLNNILYKIFVGKYDPLTSPRICLCQCRSGLRDPKVYLEKSTTTPPSAVDPSDDLPSLIIHKDAENFALRKALTVRIFILINIYAKKQEF